MLLRQAHEIEWTKEKHNCRAKSPTDFYGKILEICKTENLVFVGFVGEWEGNKTKIKLICEHGHEWICSIDKFVSKGTRCSHKQCKGKRISKKLSISETEYKTRILEICETENLIFLGFVGEWKGCDTKIRIKCKYGHEWDVSIYSFTKMNTRCPTCAGKNKTKDEYKTRILEICETENLIFLGFVGEWKGCRTKIKLSCKHGHEWISSILHFVYQNTRCPVCVGRLSIDDRMIQINQVCNSLGYVIIKIHEEWKNTETKIDVKCLCDYIWTTTIHRVIHGTTGCRKCATYGYNTKKSGTLYIQKLTNDDSFVGVKFGITNRDTNERMKNQSSKSKFDHEIFYELTLQDGQKILELENKIKEAMKGKTSYISKEDMPDGYTETVAPSELSTIMYIVKSFEKELTK